MARGLAHEVGVMSEYKGCPYMHHIHQSAEHIPAHVTPIKHRHGLVVLFDVLCAARQACGDQGEVHN